MFRLAVGEPYGGVPAVWPETSHLNWNRGEYELLISFNAPKNHEVEAIRHGTLSLVACRYHTVLTWGWRFENLRWSDCSYSWHLQQDADPTLPLPSAEPVPRPLNVILIDARHGTIGVIRRLALPPTFVQDWEQAVREQSARPRNDNLYDGQLQMLYGSFSTERMIRKLAFARCQIGHKSIDTGQGASRN